MVNTNFEFWIKVLQFIMLAILLIVFHKRRQKYFTDTMLYAFYIVLLAILNALIAIVLFFFKVKYLQPADYPYFKYNGLETIPLSLTILLLYLLSENLVSEIPPYRRSLPVIVSWSSYFSIIMYEMLSQKGLILPESSQLVYEILFKIYEIIVFAICSQIFYLSYQNAKYDFYKQPALLMFLSIGYLGVIQAIFLILNIVNIQFLYEGIAILPVIITILFVYVRYPHFIISVPMDIKSLTLSTEDGIEIYSLHPEKEKYSNPLFSSGMSAFNIFMGDALGSMGSISYLTTSDTSVLVSKVDKVLGFIITENPTRLLKRALDGFVAEYSRNYISDQVVFIMTEQDTTKLNRLVVKYFPFLEVQDF